MIVYQVKQTSAFKKDVARAKRRGCIPALRHAMSH